ncbi:bacteriohemerythrin [Pararhodospirillum photometricum]|uniref:Hemerythrin HHE cation binding region n=1 Tax=Pararhodospirillum photometricum DSM 122 TaxID=1150469 RepID=H6SQC6_PARPM|nr:hemerythrin family protein [Pararhodospirillum photometricum]CCG09645.1 Hemerythrin HHE cation binding region [Pararhodospirillum photometricum DSM 122]
MTSMAWSQRFATGIKAIDKDHSSLFDLMEAIAEHERRRSSLAEVAATLHALEVYAAEHFEREERFMISAHFPEFDRHRRAHADFRALIGALARQYRRSPDAIDLGKVRHFLVTWIMGHIMGEDMAYVPYLNGTTTPPPGSPEPSMPTEMLMRLPPEKHDIVRRFASLMRDGGEVAEALESTLLALERHHEQALDNKVRTLFAPDPLDLTPCAEGDESAEPMDLTDLMESPEPEAPSPLVSRTVPATSRRRRPEA